MDKSSITWAQKIASKLLTYLQMARERVRINVLNPLDQRECRNTDFVKPKTSVPASMWKLLLMFSVAITKGLKVCISTYSCEDIFIIIIGCTGS